MNYSKYGAKECSFCEDSCFARTVVCISCDAGMCRAYFHVTCVQKEGRLSEAAAAEDIADPCFAYYMQHVDRLERKWKGKTWLYTPIVKCHCKGERNSCPLKHRQGSMPDYSNIVPRQNWLYLPDHSLGSKGKATQATHK